MMMMMKNIVSIELLLLSLIVIATCAPARPARKRHWESLLAPVYRDAQTSAPTSYELRGTFYRDQTRKGAWKILRGAGANPEAVLYQLDPDASQGSLLYLKADDNILYFLDRSRNLPVGNQYFSYTLNRLR